MRGMPDKSTPVARGRAVLLLAVNASPVAAEVAATRRLPRPQPPGSHKAAQRFAASRLRPVKSCARRPAIDAANASFGEHAGVSIVCLKSITPRRASCLLAANARVAL